MLEKCFVLAEKDSLVDEIVQDLYNQHMKEVFRNLIATMFSDERDLLQWMKLHLNRCIVISCRVKDLEKRETAQLVRLLRSKGRVSPISNFDD